MVEPAPVPVPVPGAVPVLGGLTTYRARITVRLASGVNDPQGNAVGERLGAMGHPDVRDVRVGRVIELSLDAPDAAAARAHVDELCRQLLANPVIETWEVDVVALSA
jgi:phosphoribosylformylglycinamidine synthase